MGGERRAGMGEEGRNALLVVKCFDAAFTPTVYSDRTGKKQRS